MQTRYFQKALPHHNLLSFGEGLRDLPLEYKRLDEKNQIIDSFLNGVERFLNFASQSQVALVKKEKLNALAVVVVV